MGEAETSQKAVRGGDSVCVWEAVTLPKPGDQWWGSLGDPGRARFFPMTGRALVHLHIYCKYFARRTTVTR